MYGLQEGHSLRQKPADRLMNEGMNACTGREQPGCDAKRIFQEHPSSTSEELPVPAPLAELKLVPSLLLARAKASHPPAGICLNFMT